MEIEDLFYSIIEKQEESMRNVAKDFLPVKKAMRESVGVLSIKISYMSR